MNKHNPGPFSQGTVFFVGPTGFAGFPSFSFSLFIFLRFSGGRTTPLTPWGCHPGHLAAPDQKLLYWVPVLASRVPVFAG